MTTILLLHACERAPGACPAPDERYVPGVPADACAETEEECRTEAEIQCPDDASWDMGVNVIVSCQSSVCAEGYECDGDDPKCAGDGNGYCDTLERVQSWAADHCRGCDVECDRNDQAGAVSNPMYCVILCDPTR